MARKRAEDVVSAADANRGFSRLLREVRQGRRIVVTSHGRPIARIVPISDEHDRAAASARAALLERLRAGRTANVGRWTRDDLYER